MLRFFYQKSSSSNIYTGISSLLCDRECVLSRHFSVKSFSDNIHTDVVSPLCETVCERSGNVLGQNISGNIHTDVVSLERVVPYSVVPLVLATW